MKIWEEKIPYEKEKAETPNELIPYLLPTKTDKPCVLVVPGGAYYGLAQDHEGHQIAEFFNSKGYHAIIVLYRVAPNRYPAALSDLQRSIRVVRANAKQWKIDPEKLIVCGFSAGGHLCASSMVTPDVYSNAYEKDAIDHLSCKPNGGILCYPVISVDSPFGHVGSGKNLLGEQEYEKSKQEFCLENKVTPETPKAFLFHTSKDSLVDVKNSLIFAEKLHQNGIPVELHVFPYGEHGVGLAKSLPGTAFWPELAADWIRREYEEK